MVTSYPNRTSPVLRGKWLLENVLGAPPPPPPPDVPTLPDRGEGNEPASVRARLEQHRNNPMCATCHSPNGSAGLRARELRCHRQMAHEDRSAAGPSTRRGAFRPAPSSKGSPGCGPLWSATAKRSSRRLSRGSLRTPSVGNWSPTTCRVSEKFNKTPHPATTDGRRSFWVSRQVRHFG